MDQNENYVIENKELKELIDNFIIKENQYTIGN